MRRTARARNPNERAAAKPQTMALADALRREAGAAPESGIVEVANYGRGRAGLIPLWVGEGDLPTPSFICEAATRGARGGRDLLHLAARHSGAARGARALSHARFMAGRSRRRSSTSPAPACRRSRSCIAMLAGAGDEVVIPTPTWPNAAAATGIMGARPVEVPMSFGNGGWSLDFDRLAAAVTPRTRALFIVSPSNPTGWTATRDDLSRAARARAPARALDHRRRDLCALLVRRRGARAVVLST